MPAAAQTALHTWTGQGTGGSLLLGEAVAGVGDANGDGYADVLIGAPLANTSRGYVTLRSGLDGSELWRADGSAVHERLGEAVAGVADLDGDGVCDVLVGAAQVSVVGIPNGPGFARLLSGVDGQLIRHFDGTQSGAEYGTWLSGLGDVDDDGVEDFAIGAPRFDGVDEDSGLAHVRSGADFGVLYTFEGQGYWDRLGICVRSAGDVNADGRVDVLVGRPGDWGDPVGGHLGVYSGLDGSLLREWSGGTWDAFLGQAADGLGDVNGDGHDDVVTGVRSQDSIRIYSGVDGALLNEVEGPFSFGDVLRSVGDLDGDGARDVAVGAPNDSPSSLRVGSVSLISGATGATLWRFHGEHGLFGLSLDRAGDVNADGAEDLIVGAPYWPNSVGRAYAVSLAPWLGHGGAVGGDPTPVLYGDGFLVGGQPVTLRLGHGPSLASTSFVLGLGELSAPFKGGMLVPSPDLVVSGLLTDTDGALDLPLTWPLGLPSGLELFFQFWMVDGTAPLGFAASNGLSGTTP